MSVNVLEVGVFFGPTPTALRRTPKNHLREGLVEVCSSGRVRERGQLAGHRSLSEHGGETEGLRNQIEVAHLSGERVVRSKPLPVCHALLAETAEVTVLGVAGGSGAGCDPRPRQAVARW